DAIADDEMLAALLRNLRRAGLAHEASRALSQRIELERTRGGADSLKRIAELNLELSLLKLDDLHDPAAARKEVEAALEAAKSFCFRCSCASAARRSEEHTSEL